MDICLLANPIPVKRLLRTATSKKYEGTNKKGQHYTHEDKIDVAIRRNVLTGVGQTCKQVSLTNAKENGFDLMEINAHSGARPSHAKWQGKRVSLSGRKGYLSLHDIGYGSAEGFGGCNCRHDWYPVDENDVPMYTDNQLKDFDAKNIEYNGKKYTQYEATQIQRRKEREIRDLKREAVAYDTAIKETDDEELKSKLKDDFAKTSNKLKDKEKALADFTKETGIKRDKFREQVQGFNRSVSSKSTWANKKSRNDLTFYQSSGKIDKNTGFKRIDAPHSLKQDVKSVNPKYDAKNPLFSRNCQRCVCTYEAKRRGFDVVVKPAVKNGTDNLATIDLIKGFPSVFKNSNVIDINGAFGSSVKNNIEKQMQQFGDGSRAIIAVHWKTNNGGHVFMAEQVNGKTLFIDPQNGDTDVSNYFKLIKTSPFKPCSYLMRTDNLEFTKKIKDCCEGK